MSFAWVTPPTSTPAQSRKLSPTVRTRDWTVEQTRAESGGEQTRGYSSTCSNKRAVPVPIRTGTGLAKGWGARPQSTQDKNRTNMHQKPRRRLHRSGPHAGASPEGQSLQQRVACTSRANRHSILLCRKRHHAVGDGGWGATHPGHMPLAHNAHAHTLTTHAHTHTHIHITPHFAPSYAKLLHSAAAPNTRTS